GKDFKDAADAAVADPKNIQRVIDAAVPAPEFYFSKYLPMDAVGKVNTTALATREGLQHLRAILAKLKNIASPVQRQFWLGELAKRTGVKEKTLEEEMDKMSESQFAPVAAKQQEEIVKREVSRQERIAENLLSAAFAQNNFALLDDSIEFLNPTQKEIFRILKSGKKQSEDPGLDIAIGIIILRASDE